MEENHKDKGKRYKVMAGIDQVFSDSFTSKKIFGNDGFQFFLFQKRWKNIVGDMLAKESYIKSWKDDTLVIAVTNSVFLQHLFMMKGDLLKRLFEDEFGKRFKDIRFIAGPRQKKEKAYSTLDPVNHKIEEEQKMYSQDLTEGEEKWIENWVEGHVGNDKLKQPFQDLMTEVLKIRKGEAAAGYKPCAWCGALFDQKDKNQKLCPNCQRIFDRNIKHRAVLLLKKYPHYTFQQVRSIIGCGYSEYEEARDILIHRYKENIFQKHSGAEEKRKLLALLIHKPINEISEQEAENILKHMPEKKWD